MHISKVAKVSALLTLIFSSSSFALPIIQPTRCPTAASIQAQQDKNTVNCKDGECSFFLPPSLYDAEVQWNFVMHLDATSDVDARSQALTAMSSLANKSGPTKLLPHMWVCTYSDNSGLQANAYYTPDKKLLIEMQKN